MNVLQLIETTNAPLGLTASYTSTATETAYLGRKRYRGEQTLGKPSVQVCIMPSDSYAHHFSLANIPFGIASSPNHPTPVAATRIGDNVIFLDKLCEAGFFEHVPGVSLEVLTKVCHPLIILFSSSGLKGSDQPTLNDFAALGQEASRGVRAAIKDLLTSNGKSAQLHDAVCANTEAKLHMPVHVGDFTDFSCSADHVVNAGEAVFGERKMPPAFPHMPLGYGGRSSSIVVSGTPVIRPLGQYRSKTEKGKVEFGPCQNLDYELELGCIVGKKVKMGEIVTAAQADEHIFGVVLLNDWSGTCARISLSCVVGSDTSSSLQLVIS